MLPGPFSYIEQLQWRATLETLPLRLYGKAVSADHTQQAERWKWKGELHLQII